MIIKSQWLITVIPLTDEDNMVRSAGCATGEVWRGSAPRHPIYLFLYKLIKTGIMSILTPSDKERCGAVKMFS